MSNRDRDFLTRTENNKRTNRTQGRKKLDRLLNVLIAIVAVLILVNLYFVFSNNGEKAQEENNVESNQPSEQVATSNNDDEQVQSNSTDQETNSTSNENSEEESNNESNEISSSNEPNNENGTTDEQLNEDNHDGENELVNTFTSKGGDVIIQDSDDPLVEQIIINSNWQVTPTNQTGVHVSAYENGHIDYEEKKLTFRNAVGLSEDNVIYWSIKNNGSSENSIAVISSMDQQQKYRVSIVWVENQGWKPVKVEILNAIELHISA